MKDMTDVNQYAVSNIKPVICRHCGKIINRNKDTYGVLRNDIYFCNDCIPFMHGFVNSNCRGCGK